MAAAAGHCTAGQEMELIGPADESLATHRQRLGPVPKLASGELIAALDASGLLGRGGGGFSVGPQWRGGGPGPSPGAGVVGDRGGGGAPRRQGRSLVAAPPPPG